MARATSALGMGRMTASAQSASSCTAKWPPGPTPAKSERAMRRDVWTSASAGPETLMTSSYTACTPASAWPRTRPASMRLE
eukprot:3574790-Alexandrium_andersonii.AAC.1